MKFFSELKRRNVLRAGAAYLAGAWLLVEVAVTVLPRYGFDEALLTTLITILGIGFPLVLIFAWAYELTPQGIRRDAEVDRTAPDAIRTDKTLDRVIIIVLTLALGFFAIDKFVLDPARDVEIAESARQEGRTEALVESYGDKSIAVLAFADMSPEGDQEYLSDGIAEELLNLLAKIPELRVISRSSAFSFKGKDIDIPTVAGQLNVAHILEGSVRKAGNRIRITAQLLDARSDTHLWSESYDRELTDVFAIQDDIAAMVVEQMKVELLGQVPKTTVTDPEVFRLYTRARHVYETSLDPDQFEKALGLVQEALAIDPGYAPGWALLGRFYWRFELKIGLDDAERAQLARHAAFKALELDSNNGAAYSILGSIALVLENDWKTAAAHIQKAAALDPTDIMALNGVGSLAMLLGRVDEAIELFEYAVARDPLVPSLHMNLMRLYHFAGDSRHAAASARVALALDDKALEAHGVIAGAYFFAGDMDAALAESEQEPVEPVRLAIQAVVYHARGDAARSDALLRELLERYPESVLVAFALVGRGEIDRATDWVSRNAAALGGAGMAFMNLDPFLSELRGQPAFQEVLKQAGVSPEQLADIEFRIDLPQ
jgi:TolB-like protein/Flp pilus assembly protein TadD